MNVNCIQCAKVNNKYKAEAVAKYDLMSIFMKAVLEGKFEKCEKGGVRGN